MAGGGENYNPFRNGGSPERQWGGVNGFTESSAVEGDWIDGGTSKFDAPGWSLDSFEAPGLVDTSLESEADSFPRAKGKTDRVVIVGHPSPDRSAISSRSPGFLSESYTSTYVQMIVEERLSILFDGISPDPSCRIVGRVHVVADSEESPPDRFYLTVNDPKQHIQDWEPQITNCEEAANLALADGDTERAFRVDTRLIHQKASVLEYVCSPRLKPIPLLLKTKVQTDDTGRCRLAIRIRANPSNVHALTNLSILVVLPPDVKGNHVQGDGRGVWNEAKRVLAFAHDVLVPGEMLDLNAIFSLEQDTVGMGGKIHFPIMLQCHGEDHMFSRVEVSGKTYEEPHREMDVDLAKKSVLLFRRTL